MLIAPVKKEMTSEGEKVRIERQGDCRVASPWHDLILSSPSNLATVRVTEA